MYVHKGIFTSSLVPGLLSFPCVIACGKRLGGEIEGGREGGEKGNGGERKGEESSNGAKRR